MAGTSTTAKEKRARIINFVGLGILVLCFLGALVNVMRIKETYEGKDVIRIAHWQLELGVRDGMDELIRRFEKMKAEQGQEVKIVQIPIPEKAYTQYVTTQLIGGTAPDMIQVGFFPEEYLGRYFYPLTKVLQQKNPFIAKRYQELKAEKDKTDDEKYYERVYRKMRDDRWLDTFTDGLRGQYKPNLFEYYGVGFSQFTVRMFYNKDLFREAVGTDRPPENFRQLIAYCRQIEDYAETQPEEITPIASSKYQVEFMRGRYLGSMTADLYREQDVDMDGFCSDEEKLMAMLKGEYSVTNEQYKAAIDIMNDMADFFPRGFMSLGRMDSGFSFVQGRAGMISSGSWDAKSFIKKINELPENQRFEVGIFDLPMVAEDNPEYGQYTDGRVSEASTGTGFGFGITRYTKYFDLCVEFLQFCTLPENNTLLNEYAAWIPSVYGARATDMLQHFEPNYVGYWGNMSFHFWAGQSRMLEKQEYWPLISRDTDFASYAQHLQEHLPVAVADDYARAYRSFEEILPNRRAKVSSLLAAAVFGPAERRQENRIKLLRSWDTLVNLENGQRRFDSLMQEMLKQNRQEGYASPFTDKFLEQVKRIELNPKD
jgi:raffinose/stachyose/melibiose transport system substrate-binding protein